MSGIVFPLQHCCWLFFFLCWFLSILLGCCFWLPVSIFFPDLFCGWNDACELDIPVRVTQGRIEKSGNVLAGLDCWRHKTILCRQDTLKIMRYLSVSPEKRTFYGEPHVPPLFVWEGVLSLRFLRRWGASISYNKSKTAHFSPLGTRMSDPEETAVSVIRSGGWTLSEE